MALDNIEKEVEELLRQGLDRRQIWQRLQDRMEEKGRERLRFHLNNASLPKDRKKIQYFNLLLAGVLAFMTFRILLVAFAFGKFDIYLLLSLVVPVVNIYILKEILRFHRLGYQFLFVLSILSLFRPENQQVRELFLLALMIGLSGLFYLHLFPRKALVPPDARQSQRRP